MIKKIVKSKRGIIISVLILILIMFFCFAENMFLNNSLSHEERAAIHLNLASIYELRGEIDKSIVEINKAIEIFPEYDLAYSLLGDNYYRVGNLNKSLESYQEAVKIKEDPEYYFDIANVYYAQGELGEAQKYYLKVIELDSNATNAYLNIANILLDANKVLESKIYYDRVLEIEPYNSNAHNDLGYYYETIGDFDKAKEEYALALEIDPENTFARSNLENLVNQ